MVRPGNVLTYGARCWSGQPYVRGAALWWVQYGALNDRFGVRWMFHVAGG